MMEELSSEIKNALNNDDEEPPKEYLRSGQKQNESQQTEEQNELRANVMNMIN